MHSQISNEPFGTLADRLGNGLQNRVEQFDSARDYKHLRNKKNNIKKMANHKSSIKRIRQDKKKALHNKYYAKTMRNAVRKLRNMSDKEEAAKLYPTVQKLLDKLAKINVIHDNKAANLKSGLTKHIAKLA